MAACPCGRRHRKTQEWGVQMERPEEEMRETAPSAGEERSEKLSASEQDRGDTKIWEPIREKPETVAPSREKTPDGGAEQGKSGVVAPSQEEPQSGKPSQLEPEAEASSGEQTLDKAQSPEKAPDGRAEQEKSEDGTPTPDKAKSRVPVPAPEEIPEPVSVEDDDDDETEERLRMEAESLTESEEYRRSAARMEVVDQKHVKDREAAASKRVKDKETIASPAAGSVGDKQELAVKEEEPELVAAEDPPETLPAAYVPGRKKGKKKWLVLLAILAAAAVYIFFRLRSAKDALFPVEVMEASLGSIEETVTISGTVASASTKSYYAAVSAPIDALNVETGDRVRAGDLLCTYRDSDLQLARKQAELSMQQANGSYSGSMEKNKKATDVLVGNSIHDINNRLDEITLEIDAINNQITEKTDRMSQTITELQNTLLDINQNGIADSMETAWAAAEQEDPSTSYITRREDGDSDLTESNRQMYLAVQQSLNDKQYALAHDPEIEKWQRQITALNEEKAKLSEQKSVETSRLTGGEASALAAQRDMTELTSMDTIEAIDSVAGGVAADFAGVVTEVTVQEGSTVAKGTKLCTIASMEDVEVNLQISKADQTKVRVGQKVDITVNGASYEGEVTSIAGVATKNATGVPVVDAKIRIKNPDDVLILGVEASNKIHTNHADGVVVIPYEYVGADAAGDFVYIVENGVVTRRDVTVGLTTSTDAEIVEGLAVGDQVITGNVDSLTEGLPVSIQNSDSM